MKRICRIAALILAVALLAGCAGFGREAAPEQKPQPQIPLRNGDLTVYVQEGVCLPASLERYAAQRGFDLQQVPDPARAAICIWAQLPQQGCVNLSQQQAVSLLLKPEEPVLALPCDQTEYGYQVNTEALFELFAGASVVEDLRAATYQEWEAFIETAGDWLKKPARAKVTLNGNEYTLAPEMGYYTRSLTGLFAVDCCYGYGVSFLAPALRASGGKIDGDSFTGPLYSAWTAAQLETDHLAGMNGPLRRGDSAIFQMDAAAAWLLFAEGKALFLRTSGTDLLPVKFSFEASDVTGDVTLEQLAVETGTAPCGWVGIAQSADEALAQQGMGYLLWLVTTGTTDRQMGITSGRNSRANQAMVEQFSTEKWGKTQRAAYVKAALEALN